MTDERKRRIQIELIKSKEEYVGLRSGSLQRRIALEHKIGCIEYALGFEESEIIGCFERAAALVPDLLKLGSIEPSLALSAWGICLIARRHDVLDLLSQADSERLGTQHVEKKYIRMIANIFRANQKSWKRDFDGVHDEIKEYDRLLTRRRTNRTFQKWADGLRDIHLAKATGRDVGEVVTTRRRYLEESYHEEEVDHEGLLDVHGMGVFGAGRLGGWRISSERNPFPVELHRQSEEK